MSFRATSSTRDPEIEVVLVPGRASKWDILDDDDKVVVTFRVRVARADSSYPFGDDGNGGAHVQIATAPSTDSSAKVVVAKAPPRGPVSPNQPGDWRAEFTLTPGDDPDDTQFRLMRPVGGGPTGVLGDLFNDYAARPLALGAIDVRSMTPLGGGLIQCTLPEHAFMSVGQKRYVLGITERTGGATPAVGGPTVNE